MTESPRVTLSVWPGVALPPLTAVTSWINTGEPSLTSVDTRFADTADLRLTRMGIELCHQGDARSGTWRLTLGDGGIRAVREVEGPGAAVPDELAAVLNGAARGATIEVVAHLRTRRRTIPLSDPGGRALGTLADAAISVLDGRRVALRFRELEILPSPEAPPSLVPTLVRALEATGAAPADNVHPLVRALGPRALGAADPAVPQAGDPPTMREVVQHALAASVRRLLRHDPVVRLEAGDEGVHQMRVSTRRLRSDLRTFRPVLDEAAVQLIADECKWLADILGGVRDLDVLADNLARSAAELPEREREAAGALVERVHADRGPARRALDTTLAGDRYLELVTRLVGLSLDPPVTVPDDHPARESLIEIVRKPWDKLRAEIRSLPDEPVDEDLHQVRIRAKRSRYAAEAVADFVPAAGRHAERIADIQDVLGEHQDAVVAEQWLREAATKQELAAAEAYAAGWLAAEQRAHADKVQGEWETAWKKARKRASWLK
jgi:CHAD domain-containing protein